MAAAASELAGHKDAPTLDLSESLKEAIDRRQRDAQVEKKLSHSEFFKRHLKVKQRGFSFLQTATHFYAAAFALSKQDSNDEFLSLYKDDNPSSEIIAKFLKAANNAIEANNVWDEVDSQSLTEASDGQNSERFFSVKDQRGRDRRKEAMATLVLFLVGCHLERIYDVDGGCLSISDAAIYCSISHLRSNSGTKCLQKKYYEEDISSKSYLRDFQQQLKSFCEKRRLEGHEDTLVLVDFKSRRRKDLVKVVEGVVEEQIKLGVGEHDECDGDDASESFAGSAEDEDEEEAEDADKDKMVSL
jgi:hypothetical protein